MNEYEIKDYFVAERLMSEYDDVKGHCSPEDVLEIMYVVANLPKPE